MQTTLSAMNIQEALPYIEAFINADVPVYLEGPPGVAKTEGVYQIGRKQGRRVCDLRLLLREAVDMRGLPVPDMEKRVTDWLRPSDLPFVGSDWPDDTLLFIDELPSAPPAVQAVAFGLVQERRVGEHVLKPGVRIIAAGNRKSDRGVVNTIPTPLRNRFARLQIVADAKATCAYWASIGFLPELIAFIRLRPALLHIMPGAAPTDESFPTLAADAFEFPSPRSWFNAGRAIAKAPRELWFRLVAANVGEGPAAEFEGFCRTWQNVPPLDSIVADPRGAPVPADPGLLYAIASALARYATRQNFDSIGAYAARMPADYRSCLILDATRRDSSLQSTGVYTAWAVSEGVGL